MPRSKRDPNKAYLLVEIEIEPDNLMPFCAAWNGEYVQRLIELAGINKATLTLSRRREMELDHF